MDEYQWLEDENSKRPKLGQKQTHLLIVILEEFLEKK